MRKTAYNSTYPKGGVSCSKDSFVVNQTLVFQIKFCGKSPALRVAAKRYKIEFIRGDLVELKDFVNEESIAKKSIKSLKEEWKINNEIECMDLGGNRFEVEYYKGILILIDDLPNCKLANVIDIKINEL
jgi:hypothetical protein